MPQPKNPIQMAVVGAAHGVRGEVRVKSFTGDPLALGGYGPLYAKDGRAFEISDIRPAGTVAVVRFKGVSDRGAAEALTGTELFVDRSALPNDGGEDDFYHADLIGLAVRYATGAAIGTVVAVHDFGGGDILELTLGRARGVLIPFSKAAVPEVSVPGGYIQVDPVAAGLVETEDGDGRSDKEMAPGRAGFDAGRRPRGPKDAGGSQ